MPEYGSADVVQHRLQLFFRNLAAQHRFHLIAEARRLLHAQAGPRPHVQANQTGIHLREKVLPEKEHQPQRKHAEDQKASDEQLRDVERGLQQLLVAVAESVEAALEPR